MSQNGLRLAMMRVGRPCSMVVAGATACVLFIAPANAGKRGTGSLPIGTTSNDFFELGTQHGMLQEPMVPGAYCGFCHGLYAEDDGNPDELVPPMDNWVMSLMAQAARDPIWHAALAVANQDLDFAGDGCIRCHSPNAWLEGRSLPPDASGFTAEDFDGVNCNFCHRMVDPIANTQNPAEDTAILGSLMKAGLLPSQVGNGRYVVDPLDSRRGPLADVPANYHAPVPILVSPFHTESNLCGTCHDVSNAAFTRQSDGSYTLNRLDSPHPTGDSNDMMPEQRTYGEWINSTFASTGVYFPDGRFGGDHPTGVMQSCQDCHMPKVYGGLCAYWSGPPFFPRPDIAQHGFVGANSWVIGAVYTLYPGDSGLDEEKVAINQARTLEMLRAASDMQVSQVANQLKVRVINYSGHKLPTGYPEGRRMWVNVRFLDNAQQVIAERGAYDFDTATLSSGDTKVYEMKLGLDAWMSQQTGLPAGESFHLVLNNEVTKDNRIPPMGFNNSSFQAIQAQPVAHTYVDGQYWDDTCYAIPQGARDAVVTLYYQTTSREYIEFLRDANQSAPPHAGNIAYELWVQGGKSAPVDMDMGARTLVPSRPGDVNLNGITNIDDLLSVINAWGNCPLPPAFCPADINCSGKVDIDDLLGVINGWGG
jgi:hypothetical protein